MPTNDELLVSVDNYVAVVTLNRPEKRNALTSTMIAELPATFRDLDGRNDVRVVILTGADPAFCAGLDLGALAGGELLGEAGEPPIPSNLKTPVIGAVNGTAVTGGLELALACDFLVASTEARFADTHARVGIMPGWGLSVCLPAAIGHRRAKQMSFTGNFVDAQTACEWGLVNEVVSHGALLDRAMELANDVASIAPGAMAGIKTLYNETTALSPGDAMAHEVNYSRQWLRAGSFDRDRLDENRAGIQSRGANQIASQP